LYLPGACCPYYTAANILSVASFSGSAVAVATAVFPDVGVPWVPVDVMVSAVAGIPVFAVVLTTVNILGVTAVAIVSAVVDVTTAVYIPFR
jgi:hypothetical protein